MAPAPSRDENVIVSGASVSTVGRLQPAPATASRDRGDVLERMGTRGAHGSERPSGAGAPLEEEGPGMTLNIGLTGTQRDPIVRLLTPLLADEYVLYTKTRNFQ